jgi:phage terminase Nu1 subunit (DNA packaging protein)
MATNREVAGHLDISDRSVRQLRAKGVLPAAPRGQADLDECRVAYIRHLRERATGRSSDAADDDGLDLVQQRARLAKEQADRIASKNAVDRGELVPVSAVTLAVVGLIELSKSRLARVPAIVGKTAPKLRERTSAPRSSRLPILRCRPGCSTPSTASPNCEKPRRRAPPQP